MSAGRLFDVVGAVQLKAQRAITVDGFGTVSSGSDDERMEQAMCGALMKVLAEVCRCAGCVCLTGQDSHFEQNGTPSYLLNELSQKVKIRYAGRHLQVLWLHVKNVHQGASDQIIGPQLLFWHPLHIKICPLRGVWGNQELPLSILEPPHISPLRNANYVTVTQLAGTRGQLTPDKKLCCCKEAARCFEFVSSNFNSTKRQAQSSIRPIFWRQIYRCVN